MCMMTHFFNAFFLHFFSQYYAHDDDAAASLGHLPKVDTPSQNLEASSRAGGAACKPKLACPPWATSHSIIVHDSITCYCRKPIDSE
jgi:hypothetical protein